MDGNLAAVVALGIVVAGIVGLGIVAIVFGRVFGFWGKSDGRTSEAKLTIDGKKKK
jgi:hypothetical protein